MVLATYSATDPENQPITRWSLSGSDGGDFSIDDSGNLTFRNTPDYDRPADSNRDNEYRITVRAYDGRTYGNLDVIITVSNVNEHDPVIRSGSRTSFTYREETASVLYTYSATDGDKDDVIAWSTSGTDGHLFEFNDRNGLEFRDPPDYEDPVDSGRDNEYNLTVVVTDRGGRSASLDITVTVTAVDEGPDISGTTNYTVPEGPGPHRRHLHRNRPGGPEHRGVQLAHLGNRRRRLHHQPGRHTLLPQHPRLRPAPPTPTGTTSTW